MKRLFLLFFVLVGLIPVVSAQLSTRENREPHVFKSGTRPQEGSMGLYLGFGVTEFKYAVQDVNSWYGMPLFNFKYYLTDRSVLRLGLLFNGSSKTVDGTIEGVGSGSSVKASAVIEKSNNRFLPAYEYHFTPKNVCDVYIGAQLPIGWDSNSSTMTSKVGKDMTYAGTSTSPFLIGVGAFVGLQFFIADLPLAIGAELGYTAMFRMGTQTTNYSTDADGNRKVFHSTDVAGFEGQSWDKLNVSTQEFYGDARVTISYYFNR